MYSAALLLHSWLRWAAILLGIVTTVALVGDSNPGKRSPGQRLAMILMMVLDTQLLVGLVLYAVLSPFTKEAMQNFGAAMKNPALRFWAVEHISMMMLAIVLVHVGRVLARKAATPNSGRVRLLVCVSIATLLMIAGTPWPGTPNGRPLFRL